MAVPVSDLQGIAPSAVIELFELQLVAALHGSTDTYRFHAGSSLNANGPVYWNGNSYTRMPIEADGFEYTGGGQLPQPKLRVSNINGTVTSLLLIVNAVTSGNDLIGAKLTRIRTLARYIDATNFPGNVNPYGTPDPTVEFPREVYSISQKSLENRDLVEFTLSAAFDLQGVRAPKRQCISNICQWVYRSTECGYTGTNYYNENDQAVGSAGQDVCGKRLSSCEVRFGANNELPFGSFPGVGTYFT
jgi:lambda family phage minor tail protein L